MLLRTVCPALLIAMSAFAQAQLDGSTEQELTWKFQNNLTVGTKMGMTGPSLSSRNTRYSLSLGYSRSEWGLRGDVSRTGEQFAPRDTWFGVNQLMPRNAQDVSLTGYVSVAPNLKLLGSATRGEAIPENAFDYTNWSTQLEYRFSPNAYGILGFDNLDIELFSGPLFRRQWATLGFGMDMGQGSMFKLLLHYGEVGQAGGMSGSATNRGHVISGQVSIKF